jgi:membrane protein YqaA with SNARE-associated domain
MFEKILAVLATFTIGVISSGGYVGIALLMAIESACIPLPSEIIMPFAGYLVSTGRFDLYLAATAGAIGCNLGSIVAYEVGKRGGRPMAERWGRFVLIGPGELDAADRFFARWGSMAVLIGRLLPVIRSFIAFPAGVARMKLVLHVHRVVAVVLRTRLGRHEARRQMGQRPAREGRIPQRRPADRHRPDRAGRLLHLAPGTRAEASPLNIPGIPPTPCQRAQVVVARRD